VSQPEASRTRGAPVAQEPNRPPPFGRDSLTYRVFAQWGIGRSTRQIRTTVAGVAQRRDSGYRVGVSRRWVFRDSEQAQFAVEMRQRKPLIVSGRVRIAGVKGYFGDVHAIRTARNHFASFV
jgi:hypothetical protein